MVLDLRGRLTEQIRSRRIPQPEKIAEIRETKASSPTLIDPVSWGSIPLGTPVLVRYLDAVRFEAADASRYRPWTLELIGWLDYQDVDCIRVVNERYAEPTSSGNTCIRSTGVSIVKNTIVELRRLAME